MSKVIKKKVVTRIEAAPAPKPIKVYDVSVANAVKVGVHQLMYLSEPIYKMELQGNVISFRHNNWTAKDKTVYSTLYNVIFWREHE